MLPSPKLDYFVTNFWTLALFAFALGCCIGSYLNVVIYRVPLGLKTSEPKRSFCPACKYQIPFYHNIPIFSWLFLRGKCANCKLPISPRYLFVELLTGLLFFAIYVHIGTNVQHDGWYWQVVPAWVFLGLAISGSFIDIDHQILPHRITWGGAAAGVLFAALVPNLIVVGAWWENLLHSLGGAAAGFALIWVIVQLGKLAFGRLKMEFKEPVPWSVTQPAGSEDVILKVEGPDKVHEETWANIFSRVTDKLIIRAEWALLGTRRVENVILTMTNDAVSVAPQAGGETETIPLEQIPSMSGTCVHVEQPREAMGMGDANWMACVGAFFGWKATLFTILAGSCIGAVISLLMILLRRREWAARIPFGPYLAGGAIIWMFYGPALLNWYSGSRTDRPRWTNIMNVARGILGIVVLLAILWALSLDRRRVNWRLVCGGLFLQLVLAAGFFTTEFTGRMLAPVAKWFQDIMNFSDQGARFVFGKLADDDAMGGLFGSKEAFIFAIRVLPTIIFFSALTSVLYYLGILQRIVFGMAWVMKRVMRLSGAESLAAAGEVFLGQTESALLVKPYVPRMTRSEMATMMIGGMATIAGGVMSAYIGMLGGNDEAEKFKFAQYLLCASLMSAPAAIVAAKILVPERDVIDERLHVPREASGTNIFDAMANGTTQGLTLALNVGAMLITFVAMAALLNGVLGWTGARIPVGGGAALNDWIRDVSGGVFDKLSLQSIFGTPMAPLAWVAGVDSSEMLRGGQLLGTKLALNEFVAYQDLSAMKGQISERTVFLMSFALCGFANISSIGIQLGGIGGLAPTQRATLAALGLRALAGGTIATLMTASVAGMFR